MSIIIFILILAFLILVHELGHFLAAKSSKVRVDEFGIGFPPKILSYKPKHSETLYSINWIPLGGFVKIFGEESSKDALSGPDSERSFLNKSKLTQTWILIAGIVGNILAAWLLFSFGFMFGLPASVNSYDDANISNSSIIVTAIFPNSPAEQVGLQIGDEILEISRNSNTQPILTSLDVGEFIGTNTEQITLLVEREDISKLIEITPTTKLAEDKAVIGIGIDEIGIVTLPIHRALWEGGRVTSRTVSVVAVGLIDFIGSAFTGGADLSQVTGPVGLVGLVGDAGSLGLMYLLSFTAFISINLALINLVPFPALDGGRILFVIIEAIKGSPIKPRIANTLNIIGFALLILLMVVVTYNDIARLITG